MCAHGYGSMSSIWASWSRPCFSWARFVRYNFYLWATDFSMPKEQTSTSHIPVKISFADLFTERFLLRRTNAISLPEVSPSFSDLRKNQLTDIAKILKSLYLNVWTRGCLAPVSHLLRSFLGRSWACEQAPRSLNLWYWWDGWRVLCQS